jgi:Domain of unknown function (DUF1772)
VAHVVDRSTLMQRFLAQGDLLMLISIQILAVLAILANAVIYGTDVFGALIQRPALAAVDNRTLIQAMGNVHRVADRRLAAFTIGGLVLAAGTTAVAALGGHGASAISAGVATAAVLVFVAIYMRVSKPVNAALIAAATADEVPDDARTLQNRWDSVIVGRAILQGIAVAGLCVAIIAL